MLLVAYKAVSEIRHGTHDMPLHTTNEGAMCPQLCVFLFCSHAFASCRAMLA